MNISIISTPHENCRNYGKTQLAMGLANITKNALVLDEDGIKVMCDGKNTHYYKMMRSLQNLRGFRFDQIVIVGPTIDQAYAKLAELKADHPGIMGADFNYTIRQYQLTKIA